MKTIHNYIHQEHFYVESKVFHFARDPDISGAHSYVYDEENGFTILANKYITILLCEAESNHRKNLNSVCNISKILVQNVQPDNVILVNPGCSAIQLLSHPGVMYIMYPTNL